MKAIDLSIVIPVYNSENCLEQLNEQINDKLLNENYELIFVNDKSKDNSWNKIVSLAGKNKKIKGISLKKNSGQDNAIMAGLGQAVGEYVVVMDDDLQHSPADIRKLYAKCREGYDICYGFFSDKKQSYWKNAGSRLNDYLAELFLKKPKGLYLSPFKIMRASLVKEITEYKGPFPYIDGIILSLTSNITQIELIHQKRFDGQGNYNLLKSVSVFLKHVTGYSLYPLRFATVLGMMAAGLSFLSGAYFVVDYLTNSRRVEGWITLVLLSVFFNGLILMCLGLIGEYIGRIYLTLTSKRQYVVDKFVTNDPDQQHGI
ncbi:MAG: glycosyltransferase family 2 protein [Cyclobacteriaceae bacterium]